MYSYQPLEKRLNDKWFNKKSFYYRDLDNWKDEKGWLIYTCLDGQDAFKRLLELLDINVI